MDTRINYWLLVLLVLIVALIAVMHDLQAQLIYVREQQNRIERKLVESGGHS